MSNFNFLKERIEKSIKKAESERDLAQEKQDKINYFVRSLTSDIEFKKEDLRKLENSVEQLRMLSKKYGGDLND